MMIATIVTTFSKRGEADEVVRRLIEENFVACANLERTSSSYSWQGVERSVDEWKVTFTTAPESVDAAIVRLEELHSAEAPMIVWREQETTDTYAAWVEDQLVGSEDDSEYDESEVPEDERDLSDA